MSKKHHNQQSSASGAPVSMDQATEYRIIKHDLVRVLLLNVLYLAAILVIYFTNAKTHYLEHWAARLLHF